MNNKYVWVLFNLIASIGLTAILILIDTPIDENGGVQGSYTIAFLVCLFWFYKSLVYWRICIQADDENFDKAVKKASGS